MAHTAKFATTCIGLAALVLTTTTFLGTGGRALAAQATPSPTQRTLSGVFAPNRTFPVVSNGYFLSHQRTILQNDGPSIFVTSVASGQSASFPFWISGAWEIRVENGAVDSHGNIVLALDYTTTPGAILASPTAPQTTNVIAVMDQTGNLTRLTNVGVYTPLRVCVASDDSIWTFGQAFGSEAQGNLTYNMIQHFSGSGNSLGSYFSRAALANKRLQYHAHEQGSEWASLRCGSTTIGAYLGNGFGSFTWVEVNPATGSTQSWNITQGPQNQMSGLALLSQGAVYGSFSGSGLYQLALGNDGTGKWIAPSTSAADAAGITIGKPLLLIGNDGGSLVYLLGNAPTPGVAPALYWSGSL